MRATKSSAERSLGADNPEFSVTSAPVGADDRATRLLTRVLEGDTRAAAELFRRHAASVNGLIFRLLGDDSDRDDLVNQVFVNVFRHIGQLRDETKLRSWILSVTVNVVRQELRRRGFWRRLFGGTPRDPDLFEDVTADPETRQLLARACTALDRLSATERLAFTLRFVEGYQLQEVAELFSCSLATAKRRVARAAQHFEKLAADDPLLRERLERTGSVSRDGGAE